MGSHLIDGQFQSDKYPTTPRGKVPLSVGDVTAQDLLWEYAQRRRSVDAEFADDLETALRAAGYVATGNIAAGPIVAGDLETDGAELMAMISPILQDVDAITYVGFEPVVGGHCVWIGIDPSLWGKIRRLIDLLPVSPIGQFGYWQSFGASDGRTGYVIPIDGDELETLAIGLREQDRANASPLGAPAYDPVRLASAKCVGAFSAALDSVVAAILMIADDAGITVDKLRDAGIDDSSLLSSLLMTADAPDPGP